MRVLLLLLALIPLITACDLLPDLSPPSGVKMIIESITLSPGETARIGIIIETPGSPGLTELQVGPTSALVFDPRVIRLEGIEGVDSFVILASDIDNTKGEARFAAASILGEGVQGRVLELVITALGDSGEEGEIRLTGVDWLRDAEGNGLPLLSVKTGKVRID